MINKDYFKKFSRGLEIMEGREKGDLKEQCTGEILHIHDFGFMKGKEGEYACIILAEDADNFYYVNSIITEILKEIEEDGEKDSLKDVGVVFEMRTSKENPSRTYMAMNFVF